MGNLSFSNSRLIRTRVTNWWCHLSKSTKLLGFCASVAAVGWEFHRIKPEFPTSKSRNLNVNQRWIKSSRFLIQSPTPSFDTRKKLGNFSLASLVERFRLLTVVSCTEEYCENEDVNCECECKCNASNAASQLKNCTGTIRKPSCPPPTTSCTAKSGCHSGKGSEHSDCEKLDTAALSAKLGLQQIEWMNSDLTHEFLLRQASQVTVDSVTRILTQVGCAFEDYHLEYRRIIDVMMDCLEDTRKVCGSDLEVLDCRIIMVRANLDEMKKQLADLEVLLGSVEKLVNASAETAFLASAEYASIALSERFQSLCIELKRVRNETKEKERDMSELQALIIIESGNSLK